MYQHFLVLSYFLTVFEDGTCTEFWSIFWISRPFSTEVDFSLNEFLVLEHPEIIAYWFFMFKLVVATRPRSNIDQIFCATFLF